LDAKTRPGKSERDNLAAFRSGRVGDWREYFSESVSRWFQEEAGEALRKSGYE